MAVTRKSYAQLKQEMSALKLSVETLAKPKLVQDIHRGLSQIQKAKWSRVRDDIKV